MYHKSDNYTWNKNSLYTAYDPENLSSKTASKYRYTDASGRIYRLDSLISPNPDRPNLIYEFLGVTKVWRWTKERMQEAYESGLVIQTKPGTVPQLKRYLDEQEGICLGDTWTDIPPLNSQAKERLGYPTQKPEALLERIIKASSNEGDTVLDAYCGCGTTVAVAQKLNRRWIGIDITYQSISLILKRLEDTHSSTVLNDVIISGVPRDINSAEALANRKDDRLRKEFEKWAVLTYSKNRAAINQKKGADQGVDGRAFFPVTDKEFGSIIFQVKSGKVDARDIRDLAGTMSREKADLGIFITLKSPTQPMIKESKSAGLYQYKLFDRDIPKIQIVTVEDILENKAHLNVPLVAGVLKSAPRNTDDSGEQLELIAG